jgi:hypothetical protein
MTTPCLFAAGLDWLEALLPILFVLFWIVSQVFNAFKAVGRAGQRPPVARPPRPGADRPRADDVRGQLERQIGEFLERQAGRGGQPVERPRQAPGQRPAARPAAKTAQKTIQKTASTTAAGRTPPPLPAPQTVPGQPRPAAASGGDVAQHVRDAFAHELEHLSPHIASGAAPGETRRPAPPPAAELVAMLHNPATLRQLILLREVLDRPVSRW